MDNKVFGKCSYKLISGLIFSLVFFFIICFSINVKAETENNNSFSQANTIQANTTAYGRISSSWGDEDYYKVYLSSDGYMSIQFNRSSGGSHEVRIYDGNYDQLWYGSEGTSGVLTSPNIGIKQGYYYIKISGSNTNNYNFILNFQNASNWEREFNENFETATGIQVNQKEYGSIRESWGDDDYYKISIPSKGYFSFELNRLSGGSHEVRIYDGNYDQLWYGSEGTAGTITSPNIGINSGTFYVKISGSNTADYNFTLKHQATTNWETEFNDVFDKSNICLVNQKVYGSIRDSWGDDDYYKISIPSKGYFSIEFNRMSGGSHEVRIYNSNYDQLWYDSEGSGGKITSPNIGINSGTVYVKISGTNTADYNFTLKHQAATNWETEFNDSFDTSNSCTLNNTIYGSIRDSWGDDDYYVVNIPSSSYIRFEMTRTAKNCHEVTLYNQTFNQIWEESYYTQGNISSSDMYVQPGNIYIKISGSNTDNYSFNLKTVQPKQSTKTSVTTKKKTTTSSTKTTSSPAKAKQSLSIKTVARTIKAKAIKKRGKTLGGIIKVYNAHGTVTYVRIKKGSSKRLTINRKNGKIIVKKGTKKGLYKLQVKVVAGGNLYYKPASKIVKVKIRVK